MQAHKFLTMAPNSKKEIEENLQIPCEIEMMSICAGLAWVHHRPCKGLNNAVCLTLGTGTAAALARWPGFFMVLAIQPVRLAIFTCQTVPSDLASTTALVEYVAEHHGDPVEQSGMVTVSSSRQLKEIKFVWLELIGWWPTLERTGQYRLCGQSRKSDVLEGDYGFRKRSWNLKSVKRCVPNWFLAW